jgi:hypothetical protein
MRTFWLWFEALTLEGLWALGATPTMTGRSGSPPRNTTWTSVPFRNGKWMPSVPPPWGWSMRTQVDADPSTRSLSSKKMRTL